MKNHKQLTEAHNPPGKTLLDLLAIAVWDTSIPLEVSTTSDHQTTVAIPALNLTASVRDRRVKSGQIDAVADELGYAIGRQLEEAGVLADYSKDQAEMLLKLIVAKERGELRELMREKLGLS